MKNTIINILVINFVVSFIFSFIFVSIFFWLKRRQKMGKKPKKIKVIHGTFIENPKCKICGCDIPHEWLAGDYTLLMCAKKECWEILKNIKP
jgi:hypothetical protein